MKAPVASSQQNSFSENVTKGEHFAFSTVTARRIGCMRPTYMVVVSTTLMAHFAAFLGSPSAAAVSKTMQRLAWKVEM
jgi:hypothetical protein